MDTLRKMRRKDSARMRHRIEQMLSKDIRPLTKMTKFMPDFSQQDYELMIDAIDYRRSHYTVGDAFYNELSDIIEELERRKVGCW